MKKLKNLTQYNFTATFIKADVTVRERKSSSLENITSDYYKKSFNRIK